VTLVRRKTQHQVPYLSALTATRKPRRQDLEPRKYTDWIQTVKHRRTSILRPDENGEDSEALSSAHRRFALEFE
jgi:hypothetical protein